MYDLYLPRLLKNTKSKSLLTFQKYMSPPHTMFREIDSFRNANLHWVENTPEELEAATKEMLERTVRGLFSPISDDSPQKKFKTLAETCGLKYDGRPVKAFTPISRDFLEQHQDLL